MKLTILFGSDSELQRIDHHQLIKDWGIDNLFCTDSLTLKFVKSIHQLSLGHGHAVIRTIDPQLTFETIAAIHNELPAVDFIAAQTLLKPHRLPVLPFAPRGFGKSVLAAQWLQAQAGIKPLTFDQVWVDEAEHLTKEDILRDFRAGMKDAIGFGSTITEEFRKPFEPNAFLLSGSAFQIDPTLIPWDNEFEIESLKDQIRQKQIRAVQDFERKFPGVPWEIHTGPSYTTEHESYSPKSMETYRNEYTFTVRPKFPIVKVKP